MWDERGVGQLWVRRGGATLDVLVSESFQEKEGVAAGDGDVGHESGCDGAAAGDFGEVAEAQCPCLLRGL